MHNGNGHSNGNGSNGASGWAMPGPGWIDSAAEEDVTYIEPMSAPMQAQAPSPEQAPLPPLLSAPQASPYAQRPVAPPMTAMPIPAPRDFAPHGGAMAMGNPDVRNGGHFLGMSTLVVGLGALLGAKYGGWYGSFAGSLFGGSAINGYRAATQAMEGTREGDREAIISGTYAVLAAGLAGYVLYRSQGKTASRNPDEPRRPSRNPPRNCGIRPII